MQRQSAKRVGRGGARHVDDLGRGLERRIAALAGRQHGVVARRQLLALGLGPGAIDHRVRKGWLHVVHRGVYLLGHRAATWRTHEMAAILACGPTAVLSHGSAASFWAVLPYPARSNDISVTLPAGNLRSKPGIRVYRVRALAHRDFVVRDSIPVTTPARTLLDLAAVVPVHDLERALAEAQVRRLVSKRQLAEQLERNRRRRGTLALRALIEAEGGPAPTRSEAERRLLGLVRAASLPVPEANVRVGRHEVDFLWRAQRLVAEVDGFRFHRSRASFERDRGRDAELVARGLTVIRFTWRQLVGAPESVVARLAAALARRG